MMRSIAFLALTTALITIGALHAAEFEVAYIKPNPSLPLMVVGPEVGKGEVTGTRVTLQGLVMAAYDLPAPRVIGPGWLDGDRFDIVAKGARDDSQDELRAKLQVLLKQRFHLLVHTETREMPAYDLVIAKGGVRMTKYGEPGPEFVPTGKRYPGVRNIASMSGTFTLAQFAFFLSRSAGKPVLDKTGLESRYEFSLAYKPDVLQADGGTAEFGPPDLFTAIQEQLGLRLTPTKASLSVVVVDQMDRMPTEN